MKPTRVPDDLIEAGFDAIRAWHAANPGSNSYLDDRTQMRIVLAAALTLHDQQVEQPLRERVEAAERALAEMQERIGEQLRRRSHDIRREAEKTGGTRGHELRGESAGFWMAARDVLDGTGNKPICQSTRTTSSGTFHCARVQDHTGQHRTVTGTRWGMPDDNEPEDGDRG